MERMTSPAPSRLKAGEVPSRDRLRYSAIEGLS
jgi:hypothetical protein